MPKLKDRILVAVLFIILSLSGCSDAADLSRRVFVVGIGVDCEQSEPPSFTFRIAAPVGTDTAVGENSIEYRSRVIKAASFAEAVRELERSSSGEVSLDHLGCVVLGVNTLERDLSALLDYLFAESSARRQSSVFAVAGMAQEFLDSDNAPADSAAVLERLDDSRSRTGVMTLGRLGTALGERSGFRLFYLKSVDGDEEDDAAQILPFGAAIFDAGVFTGFIDAQDAELMRLFTDGQASGLITSIDENGSVFCYRIESSECIKTISTEGGRFQCSVSVSVDCELVDSGGAEKETAPSDRQIADSLRTKLLRLVNLSRTLGAAVIGFEDEARQTNRAWYEQHRVEWSELYSSADIMLNVACHADAARQSA